MENVIFDLDGTLVDSLPGIEWSVKMAMTACGMDAACPDLKPLIGPPIRMILARITGAGVDVLDRMETVFRRSYDEQGWRRTALQAGTRSVLEELRARGTDLWLVTNKPAGCTGKILQELGIAGAFREVVCPDSRAPRFAAKAEMLLELLDSRRLPRRTALMVGDTLEDCRAAVAAGIGCAVVPHGYGTPDSPVPEGCRCIEGWEELLDWAGRPSTEKLTSQVAAKAVNA